MKRNVLNKTALLTLALSLNACAVGEDYSRPEIFSSSVGWNALTAPEPELVEENKTPITNDNWWKKFNDEKMNKLVATAIEANNDLQIAEARILEARANEDFTNANLFPQVDGVAGITRERLIDEDRTSTFKQAGLSGNWEVDVFGGNRRRNEAAEAGAQAAEWDRNSVRLRLISDVARNYILFRSYQAQYELTVRNIEAQKSTLKIATEQRKAGAVSDLDVVRARAQVEATNARLPQIQIALFGTVNRLIVLTNTDYPTIYDIVNQSQPIPTVKRKEVVSIPINTLQQRPDIKTAERRLAEATALSSAAFANYFPKFSLSAFFGVSDSNIGGSNTPFNYGANALLPLLNFGRISSQVDAADARKMQAFLNYKQTVLLAVEETENSLYGYLRNNERMSKLSESAKQQAKAAEIAREQYRAGLTGQIDLLTAERAQLDAENDLVVSESDVSVSLVTLYRSLGD